MDWSSRHLHNSFFDYLSYYSNVSELTLSQCRFSGALELRKYLIALPGLRELTLSEVLVVDEYALRGRILASLPLSDQTVASKTSQKLL